MTRPDSATIIGILENARKRPLMYFTSQTAQAAADFLCGVNIVCWTLGCDRFYGIREKVVAERGWEVTATPVWHQIARSGLTPEAMVDELLAIEIETWKRARDAER